MGSIDVNSEGIKVPVIDADNFCLAKECPFYLVFTMNLNQTP